jgi:YVTN family beta-propeller protein
VLLSVIVSSGSSSPAASGRAEPARVGNASTAGNAQGRGHSAATQVVSPLRRIPPGPPSDLRKLTVVHTIAGHISPKSVAASDTGLVFAQNMMYTHTITVYRSNGSLVKTIPDTVDMARFGIQGHPGISHGAPVEAAFTPDAREAYVSNYSMYGSGFGPEGSDGCTASSAAAAGVTDSYIYRIATSSLAINQVIKVGMVPKFLTVTPDGRYVLVANWCSSDLSVVSTGQGREVARLPMGAYPRGLTVSPDSKTAYVAIMGSDEVVKVNLSNLTRESSFVVGPNPRHLVIDSSGRYLYASLNGAGEVVKVNLADDSVVATQHTGAGARSLAVAADGRSLYVVNYDSNTITKLRARDLGVLQDISTGVHPIGITYDAWTGNVWAAVYSGRILVMADR